MRRCFPQASTAAYLLAVAAVALGSQFYYLLLRPYIYEYAILCGAALLMLGLWLWLSAASTPVEKRGALVVNLVFGSLCVALVAGCAPRWSCLPCSACRSSGRSISGKNACAASRE